MTKNYTGVGRPPGQVNCQYMPTADAGSRCRLAARVRIAVQLGEGDVVVSIVRCWKHYVALENAARKPSSTITVISAEEI